MATVTLPRGVFPPPYLPTAEEIAARCAEIRSGAVTVAPVEPEPQPGPVRLKRERKQRVEALSNERHYIAGGLRLEMARKGWTQAEMSEAAGISPWTVNAAVNGRTCPTMKTVHKLATGLGIAPEALIGTPREMAARDRANVRLATDAEMIECCTLVDDAVDFTHTLNDLTDPWGLSAEEWDEIRETFADRRAEFDESSVAPFKSDQPATTFRSLK